MMTGLKNNSPVWIPIRRRDYGLILTRAVLKNVTLAIYDWTFAAEGVPVDQTPSNTSKLPIVGTVHWPTDDDTWDDNYEICACRAFYNIPCIPILPTTEASIDQQMEMVRAMLYPSIVVFSA